MMKVSQKVIDRLIEYSLTIGALEADDFITEGIIFDSVIIAPLYKGKFCTTTLN